MIIFTKARKILLFTLLACSMESTYGQEMFASFTSKNTQTSPSTVQERFKGDITIRADNMSLEDILKLVEAQSKYAFIYTDDEIPLKRKLSFVVVNKPIELFLSALLTPINIQYKLYGRQIVLTNRKKTLTDQSAEKNATPAKGPGPDASNSDTSQSENSEIESEVVFTVRGKVTDDSGNTLPGVNILEKGTINGTVTDAEGLYTLAIIDENAILVFSYVGFVSQEVSVSRQSSINVALSPDVETLSEVVVVGYGTQKKINLTGAVSTVDSEMLESRPVNNVVQSLQGLVPGLNISNTAGGEMGTTPAINIRGLTTIGMGSRGNPLILIDGMAGDINSLNPQDIDNISVLKDAAASSIYGSRAPFGVILITTKQGKAGKARVTYNASFRSNSPISTPDMVDSHSFALLINDMETNGGFSPLFNDAWLQRIKDFQDGKIPMNTYKGKQYPMTTIPYFADPAVWGSGYNSGNDNVDWYEALYKSSSPSQEHSVSVSGGNETISYYVSGDFLDAPGLMKLGGDHQDRITGTAKINAKLSDKVSVTYIGRFTRARFEQPQTSRGRRDFWFAAQAWPLLPLYDPNGYLFSSPSAALFIDEGGRENRVNDIMTQQVKLTVEPVKGWKIFGDINYSLTNNLHHVDVQKLYNHDVLGNPILYDGNSAVTEDISNANFFSPNVYSEYAKTIGNHNLKVLAGFQSEMYKYRSIAAMRNGIIVPSLPVVNTTSGTDYYGQSVPPSVSGDYLNWSTVGYFGRVNYDYDERYLFEANLRYDGTSRFRSDQRWKLFPSVSLGWNIARESFWENLEQTVSNFKLRGSYGELGNQNTSNYYPTYSVMGVGTANGDWLIGGARPNTATAPALISTSLTWEKVRTYNVGVDAGFLDNRLTATFDYFVRFTDDMVGPAPELPVVLGTAVPVTNNTNLKTYGLELELDWQDRLSNGLGYDIRFILADSRTDILRYPNPTGNIGYYNDWSGFIAYNGYNADEAYGNIWGYSTLGIAKTQAEMDDHLASLPNGGQTALLHGSESGWGAGDIMYKDLNGDGKISSGSNTLSDPGDRSVIGNITPRYSFGFNLGGDWKNFDLNIFFQGVMKRDYFYGGYMFWGAGRSMWETTAFTQHLDYFRDDPEHPLGVNTDSYYPQPKDPNDWSGLSMGQNHWAQTKYLQNAAYLRLKNLTIGYTLPQAIAKRAGIQKFRLYVSGENILTATKLTKIFDPETVDNPSGNAYPLYKVYSFGLNVTL